MQHVWAVALLGLAASLRSAIAATPKPTLVIYGDSLSDDGNLFKASMGTVPTSRLYWDGRFTNAPGTWSDHIRNAGKASVLNLAFGGAPACKFNLTGIIGMIPAAKGQVDLYFLKMMNQTLKDSLGTNKIHVFWIGHNDVLLYSSLLPPDQAAKVPGNAVECIANAANTLLAAGETTVFLTTFSPAHLLPQEDDKTRAALKQIVASANALLRTKAAALRQKYPKATIGIWDASSAAAGFIVNYKKSGFKTAAIPCLTDPSGRPVSATQPSNTTVVCAKPNDHVFYDPHHFSSRAHRYLAKSLSLALTKAKVINTPLL